jgi:hypothetical protein
MSGGGQSARVFSDPRNQRTCIEAMCRFATSTLEEAHPSLITYDEGRVAKELIEQHCVSISFSSVAKVSDMLYTPTKPVSKLSRRTDKNTSK